MYKTGYSRLVIGLALLLAGASVAQANTSIYRGGLLETVDLAKEEFTVVNTTQRSYDINIQVDNKPREKFTYRGGQMIFILDGVPATPEQALKPGNKLKRAFIKSTWGCAEFFSADSPWLKPENAQYAVNLYLVVQKTENNRTFDRSVDFVNLRLEYRDGKLVDSQTMVGEGGAHQPLFGGTRCESDLSGLKLVDGRLSGEIKFKGPVTGTVTVDAQVKDAVLLGKFKGKKGDADVYGLVEGELDFQSPVADPATVYVHLVNVLKAGTAAQNDLLLKVVFKTPGAAEVETTCLADGAPVGVKVEKPALQMTKDKMTGSLTLVADGKAIAGGTYALNIGSHWGTIGTTGGVGSGMILSNYRTTLDGQSVTNGDFMAFVRNGWRLPGTTPGK